MNCKMNLQDLIEGFATLPRYPLLEHLYTAPITQDAEQNTVAPFNPDSPFILVLTTKILYAHRLADLPGS